MKRIKSDEKGNTEATDRADLGVLNQQSKLSDMD